MTRLVCLLTNSLNFTVVMSAPGVKGGVKGAIPMGMVGQFRWEVEGGSFLHADSLALPDLAHFAGNQTVVSSGEIRQFNLMSYYAFATTGTWLEVHAEHARAVRRVAIGRHRVISTVGVHVD